MALKLATPAQLNALCSFYEMSIGYVQSRYYINQLKRRRFTSREAWLEMQRIIRLKNLGYRDFTPQDWVEPSKEELHKFLHEFYQRGGLVVHDSKI